MTGQGYTYPFKYRAKSDRLNIREKPTVDSPSRGFVKPFEEFDVVKSLPDVKDVRGVKERWLLRPDGYFVAAIYNYNAYAVQIASTAAPEPVPPPATTPTVTQLSPEDERDLRGALNLLHQSEALIKHVLGE